MRGFFLLLIGAVLASCTAAMLQQPRGPNPDAQLAYQRLTAGKVAGPPVSCLPSYRGTDMRVIDGRTIGFRNGGVGRTYIMHLSEGCEQLGSAGPYALVSKEIGGMGTCQGDIQQVVDTMSRINVGSCVVEAIIPYTSVPGQRR